MRRHLPTLSLVVSLFALFGAAYNQYRISVRWRDLAFDAQRRAIDCKQARAADLADYVEDIDERAKHFRELAEHVCRDTCVDGLHFAGLTRSSSGVYSCRCER